MELPCQRPRRVQGFLLQQIDIILTIDSSAPDLLSWKGNSKGVLTFKFAWDSLRGLEQLLLIGMGWCGIISSIPDFLVSVGASSLEYAY